MDCIENRLQQLLEELQRLQRECGFEQEVTLIAVSKTVDPSRIAQAVRCGALDLGENKVQEILAKKPVLSQDIRWHLIGSVQTNKVRQIIDQVHMIHSLDRKELAQEINRRAGQKGLVMDVLVQVNISGETSKHGIDPETTREFVTFCADNYPNLRIRGLMAMASNEADPEDTRPMFRAMRALFDDLKDRPIAGTDISYLSMGMSNDYKVAIEEGSNMVRIGSRLFGERNYQ